MSLLKINHLLTIVVALLMAAPASAEALLLLRGNDAITGVQLPSMASCKTASDYMRKNQDRKRWEGGVYGNFSWLCVPISEASASEQPWD